MMNRRSLMISTMLMSAMGVGVGGVWAADVQCLKTPSCEELGYTEVACFQKFTCTGENQTGGVGEACNGKYASCSCSSGLMWNDGACDENCPIGSILFNDFTCSDDVVSGKTPIGVVVYKDGKGAGQALALNSVGGGTTYKWSTECVDISGLPNLSDSQASQDSDSQASQDYASCENSAIIRAQGNSSTYPAVWAADNYWCLPAAGIFTSYYNNQSVINTGFSRAGGTKFSASGPYGPYTHAWSSSENNSDHAWISAFHSGHGLNSTSKNYSNFEVRPVIGFCDDAENYVYDQATDSCVKPAEFGQCNGYAANCALGDILFSDGTCSANTVSGKTPIAVVVYKSDDGKCGQAMALNSVGEYEWGGSGTDISGLTNYTSDSSASKDYASCENSAKIRAQGNSSTYPAVWAAYNYSTEGTKIGDWCLPAAGIFTSYYNNQSVINTGFSRAGGTKFTTSTYAWSSSEYDSSFAWLSYFNYSYGLNDDYYKYNYFKVRPVLAF